ncbi:SNF2-related [Macleaya cordata]|uniref:SNF2-related n=1 Tax=Macleaya cordata TaxID=56857 RepID=A0A200QU32_MACCD|nr:SNF2-related [Macleaya cordata]
MQSLQQQQLRKPEGDEALLAYPARNLHGVMGGSNFPSSSGPMHLPQQSSKFDLSQQHGSAQIREESQNKVQGVEQQHMQNPIHQAYMQYAFQAAHQKSALGNMLQQQQGKMGLLGPPSGKDQDVRPGNLRMQELMSIQAANQSQGSASRKSAEHFVHGEKQMEQGQQPGSDQRNESKPSPQVAGIGQLVPANMMRPVQTPQAQPNIQNLASNQLAMAQLQAMQAWALEHNIDLSLPANANLITQLLPLWQSRMAAAQKSNEGNAATQTPRQPTLKQHTMSSPPVGSESSAHGNSSSDVSGQSGSAKARPPVPSGSFAATSSSAVVNANNIQMQQHAVHGRESQASKQPMMNGMPPMHPPQSSMNTSQGIDYSLQAKSTATGPESSQAQYFRQLQQLNRSSPQSAVSSNEGGSGSHFPSQGGPATQVLSQRLGFTKQQLHVLKAQILAFRRLKRGEGSLPQEVLRAIAPPPLESQLQQVQLPPGTINHDRSSGRSVEEPPRHLESNERAPQVPPSNRGGQSLPKEESFTGEEKATTSAIQMQGVTGVMKEPVRMVSVGKEVQGTIFSVKSEQEVERGGQKIPVKGDLAADRGKAILPQVAVSDTMQVEKPTPAGTVSQPKDVGATRKYPGPLFDFPYFSRKHDSVGSTMMGNNANNLTLAYDVKDLLLEEGMEVLSKKRDENLKKITGLLAVNLERKRISPDLVLRLQIEEKKLRLLDLQARVRDEVDQQQQEIMAMPDRPYRKFVRLCERQRMELARQVQVSQKILREKQLRSIFQWRKKLLEAHWAIRDARTARNRGVAKYHERMLREFSKRKDEDRNKRMEALKNNDVDRYREMLLEQQTTITGDAAQRYSVLSSFLSQTEEYLHKLGGKITATKNQQEVEDAANAAAAAARSQGLSEEEVKAAATCAGEEVMIRNRFSEMNARKENSSVNKYYNLAHAVNEKVFRQPSMLRAGTLRDYQLVGLQWMLSLYNNKLNGILADEMGLGKTVQVMALIAYLMEFKGNYGPHLIIVPNAVLVNWKSELHNWLPSVSCIYYVGGKDQRSKLFSQEVCAMKFNVLVTTYEFIMFDRSKLSKVDWKYIIIDEAQRMKDRESVLARDLDRYRCQRRLLLTGTPLQNDLKELWSLLNLLLPEVFDNRKVFHDWFSKPFQKDAPVHDAEDDWLETEKKVIIIHRLHQILEPFMLRRRVEDVEGSLPRKVSFVLRCKMSAIQGAIYDWIKSTGTIRVDPEDELRRVQKNPLYQAKTYKTLNNKCMELRKACNHPLLNYPYFNDYSKDFLVRSCGKLWILDRILIKLQRTGHRVLLFSTMTKLLDILEEYLQWRRLVYRRIDGTTSLDDRESAIVEFNRPDTDCFIFLLSIRAAGRGLNLQTADTVVIYDPDPNPKNEEQAVARAHRIGQKREVKVIYMEAVVDKISSNQKEDEMRSGGSVDSEDDLAGKDRYMGSIESLIRNNIQQYKIDMADEVINAGRFDQRTTHEERRMTLETLLHDEERYQETVHNVPSLQEVNRLIARSEEEVELFDQMDEELDWAEDMTRYEQVPEWLRASSREVNAAIANLSKKPSKNILVSNAVVEPSEMVSDISPAKTERRRGRPKGSSNSRRSPIYRELDEGEFSEASSEERIGYSLPEEEGEIGEFEEEEGSGAVGAPPINKDQSGEEGLVCDGGYEYPRALQGSRSSLVVEEAGSSGSSSGSRRLVQIVSPLMSSQKFGSLSALDARPGPLSKRLPDELEEGEIAVSGDSQVDLQQSGSWIHDRDDGDDEQVLQPKIKRKRSIRSRPRHALERLEDRPGSEKSSLLRGSSSQLAFHADHDYDMQPKTDPELETFGIPVTRHDPGDSVTKNRRNVPSRRGANSSKSHVMQKPIRLNSTPVSVENTTDHSRESWDGRAMNSSGTMHVGTKMSDIVQRKCKNVVSKLQRRIDKDGPQIVPLLTDFWKRNEISGYMSGMAGSTILDLRRIDQRVDRLDYNGVMDFVSDVQSMLKNVVQYFGFSYEVRSEAKKVQDLFFDVMKIAFPDTDLREARSTVLFSAAAATSAPSPKQGPVSQSKRHKLINEVEPEPSPPPKLHQRGLVSGDEEVRTRGPISKFQKESRLGSSGGRELSQQVEAPLLTHPGELVICKKKRNDRDKSVVKPRTTGPVSPPSVGRVVRGPGPGSNPVQRDVKISQPASNQHGWAHQPPTQQTDGGGGGSGSGGGNMGWAKPVKRMRTDTGKRRPSHL